MFENRDISEITEADLQSLIGIQEGRDLEFKRDNYTPNKNKEFLADLTSFANTVGGHIFIGIAEENGVANLIQGIDIPDSDAETLRYESIIRTGLQPRLAGVQFRFITLQNERKVLVIRILKSWNAPHRVTVENSNRFYLRSSAGKYEPDVDELRGLFLATPSLQEKISDFRQERIAKIMAGDTPVAATKEPCLVVHLLPYSAFAPPYTHISVQELQDFQMSGLRFMPMVIGNGCSIGINLDGLFFYNQPIPSSAFILVQKNGCMESVCYQITAPGVVPKKINLHIVKSITKHTSDCLAKMQSLGISPPIIFFVTIVNVKGLEVIYPHEVLYAHGGQNLFDRAVIAARSIVLNDYPSKGIQLSELLQPAFDELANAGGYPKAPVL